MARAKRQAQGVACTLDVLAFPYPSAVLAHLLIYHSSTLQLFCIHPVAPVHFLMALQLRNVISLLL